MNNSAIAEESVKENVALFDNGAKSSSEHGGIFENKKAKTPEEKILLFNEAIDLVEGLSIKGTAFFEDEITKKEGEVFMVENTNPDAQDEIVGLVISELIEKINTGADAISFVDVVLGKRQPLILDGITRIVGYFSRVKNWNKSKHSELLDRSKGIYSVNKGGESQAKPYTGINKRTMGNLN